MSNGLGDVIELVGGYLKQIWLKRRYIVIVPWLLAPLGWYAVLQMPDEYRTSAKLYIDTDSIIRPLLRGLTVETDTSQQMGLMIQTLLSRPNVEKIARLADLDLTTRTDDEFRDLVTELQATIKLDSPRRQRNMYIVSYQHEDARIAKQVVESAITVLTENSLGEARSDSESAQEFLSRQVDEYAARLRELQNMQNDFRRENAAVLALTSEGYVRELQTTRLQLARESQRLNEIEARLESARLQLMDEIENPSPFNSGNRALGSAQYSTIYDGRIETMQSNMDQLLLRFTKAHPDVKEMQRRLDELQDQRQLAINELKQQAEAAGEPEVASPLFQVAKMSVNELEKEKASLTARIEALSQAIMELETNFAEYPTLASKLGGMEREYSISFQKYNELLQRQETAAFSEEVDTGTETFQIRLVEPPQLPREPSYPPREPFLGGVTLLTVLLGAGLALLISQLNPVVVSGRDLSKATGVPLLGSVSLGAYATEQQQDKKSSRVFWSAGSGFAALFVFVMLLQIRYQIHTEVPPLDVALADLNEQVGRLVSVVKTKLL